MEEFIKSPLNYTGGKYKILNQIMPIFPLDIHSFVDLFAGGLNVGINVNADRIYANDQNTYIIDLFRYFKETALDEILNAIKDCIAKYGLTETNVDGYLELRQSYNEKKSSLYLFVLTCFAFNHQIRFNAKHEFNTPFGKERSAYNPSIERNLIRFVLALKKKKTVLTDTDFMNFDFSVLGDRDFVYCDPPYLITTGSYNDGNRGFKNWTEMEERQLLNLLDYLDEKNIHFALSNVFRHKERTNDILINWSQKYCVYHINKDYSNCSYHGKSRESKTDEVVVTNFERAEPEWVQMELEI